MAGVLDDPGGLRAGEQVGNYVLEGVAGRGGAGVVYRAAHKDLGTPVAIKVLHPEFATIPAIVRRFLTEAQAPNAIPSDHVVKVLDFGTLSSGAPYSVMEWLEGRNLDEALVPGQPMELSRALHIARQVGRTLVAAHKIGIVHRDLKPENVFLQARSRDPDYVKLLDFGIAKLVLGEVSSRTATGALLGTPYYMSPEQCAGGRAIDHRTDIYSLGVILYELLAGVRPFDGSGIGDVLVLHMTKAPLAPAVHNPRIPAALDALILRMLAKKPEGRPQRVEDVLRELVGTRQAVEDEVTGLSGRLWIPAAQPASPLADDPGVSVQLTTVPVSRQHRKGSSIIVGVSMMAAIAVGSAWVVSSRDPPAVKTLRFAYLQFLDLEGTRHDGEIITRYLSKRLARPVELVLPEDVGAAANALSAGLVDVAQFNPLGYVQVQARVPTHRIAQLVARGSPGYQGLLVTRSNAGLTSLADVTGKRICWVSPSSTSGYLAARLALRERGIDPDTYFSQGISTGDHMKSLRALLNDECQVAATYAGALQEAAVKEMPQSGFSTLMTTGTIPLDAVVVRADLPAADRAAVRDAFLAAAPGSQTAKELATAHQSIDGYVAGDDTPFAKLRSAWNQDRVQVRH